MGAATAAFPSSALASVVSSAYEEDVRGLALCAAGTSLLYATVVHAMTEWRWPWVRRLRGWCFTRP